MTVEDNGSVDKNIVDNDGRVDSDSEDNAEWIVTG